MIDMVLVAYSLMEEEETSKLVCTVHYGRGGTGAENRRSSPRLQEREF
jgi:hypothetical protein